MSDPSRDAARGQYRTTITRWALVPPYIRYRYERARERLPDRGVVYELGCGVGTGLSYLARSRPDLTFVGVDMSEGAIEYGREHFGKIKNLTLEALPDLATMEAEMPPGCFLVALEVIEHLNDEQLIEFKTSLMAKVDACVFSFPYNQQNIEGTDHLQSLDVYDIFEIFPGFEAVFMRRHSIKFIGFWERRQRLYLREHLNIGGEENTIPAIANVVGPAERTDHLPESERDPPRELGTLRRGLRRFLR